MSVFTELDYRRILKDFIQRSPSKGRGQVSRMAEHLGVNSTLVSQILSGLKDLTIEQALLLCEYMSLRPLESDYFILLVERERAGTKRAKDYFKEKIEKLRTEALLVKNQIPEQRSLTDHERSIFYSSWIYSAVRMFCSVGQGKNIEEICAEFSLDRKRATEILDFLIGCDLCRQNENRYVMGAQRTHLEYGSPFLVRHHSNWRIKSIQRADDLAQNELMFTSPCSLSRADFEKIREELLALIRKTNQAIIDSPAEEVACMNIDWFYLNKPKS